MALAGRGHVLVAVEPDLHGALVLLGSNGCNGRPLVGLRFLAAEATAHAAHFHRHGMARHAQRMRNQMLGFARPLRGAIDGDVLILAGDSQRNLTLKIEMILPTKIHAVLDTVRRGIDGRTCITALQRQRRGDKPVLQTVQRIDGIDTCRFFIFDLCQTRGAARLIATFRDNRKDRLAVKLNLVDCKDRVVMHARWRNIVFAGHVLVGQHVDYAGSGAHCRQINRLE